MTGQVFHTHRRAFPRPRADFSTPTGCFFHARRLISPRLPTELSTSTGCFFHSRWLLVGAHKRRKRHRRARKHRGKSARCCRKKLWHNFASLRKKLWKQRPPAAERVVEKNARRSGKSCGKTSVGAGKVVEKRSSLRKKLWNNWPLLWKRCGKIARCRGKKCGKTWPDLWKNFSRRCFNVFFLNLLRVNTTFLSCCHNPGQVSPHLFPQLRPSCSTTFPQRRNLFPHLFSSDAKISPHVVPQPPDARNMVANSSVEDHWRL